MSAPSPKPALLDDPDLILQMKYDEGERGYRVVVQIGDDPFTKVEPWHLEILTVAAAKIGEYLVKLERHVIREYVGQAEKLRESQRRMLAEMGEDKPTLN